MKSNRLYYVHSNGMECFVSKVDEKPFYGFYFCRIEKVIDKGSYVKAVPDLEVYVHDSILKPCFGRGYEIE